MTSRFLRTPHFVPVAILVALCALWWNRVLVGDNVLLPGHFLRGFSPFGSDAQAPWNLLHWDGVAQYFPWRSFAARKLHAGQIPLWNPHQFAGTPFVANLQSAVFYPLNFPFWTMDVARAFGVSAFLHSLLATISTYFLAQHWRRSRAASLLAAIAFGFGGYLTFWATLPTLSNSASWIPLLLLLFEYSMRKPSASRIALLTISICCALLAGHAQVFFYALLALLLRALCLPRTRIFSALRVLVVAVGGALCLGAIQLLPTLELARLGHRAGQSATMGGWEFVQRNALQAWSLPSLFISNWPQLSFDENRGYVGFIATFFALCALGLALSRCKNNTSSTRCAKTVDNSALRFACVLTIFALLFATATPLAQAFYFGVPGLSQMGGVGRALVLWNLGIAFLAAFGLDWLRTRVKSNIVAPLAIGLLCAELFAANWNTTPTAPHKTIYPATKVTTFLKQQTENGARALFLMPRRGWFATEDLPENATRTHPRGVLPPNGASVYGLNDVNGYDSLSSGAFRQWLIQNEGADISPPRNGNIVMMNNLDSPALDALDVRFVVSETDIVRADLTEVLRSDGCIVYARQVLDVPRKSGRDFFPGWTGNTEKDEYSPQSFRLGSWISLCTLMVLSFVIGARLAPMRRR